MLQNHATLRDARTWLNSELSPMYPGGETASMITLIMEHCGFSSTECLAKPHRKPGAGIVTQIKEIVADIHTGKPIQYVLGYTQFCDLKICVNENVLIPRPETEEMVCKITKETMWIPDRIIDLGTGSGCIALALKKRFRDSIVCGLDISGQALELARHNGRENRIDVEWINEDMLVPDSLDQLGSFGLVVSNPPYVMHKEKIQMNKNVLNFEPASALFVSNDDPLIYYRALATFSKKHLATGGKLWIEINERFGEETASLLKENGLSEIVIHKDIHEKERFIEAGG